MEALSITVVESAPRLIAYVRRLATLKTLPAVAAASPVWGKLFERNIGSTNVPIAVFIDAAGDALLDGGEASAGADVAVSGLTGERILLDASSGADLRATDMQATTVEIEVSSGADLSANGTCTSLDVDVSSGAHAEVGDLACTDAEVEASSGANVTLRASGSLRAKASSGADITVRGKPANARVEESSGGKVTIGD